MAKASINNSGSRQIPVKEVEEFSVRDNELRHRRIAEKAYELFHCRGCCHGRDLDDWLEAERLVMAAMQRESDRELRDPSQKAKTAK
jgi:hypothetical protein